MKRIFTACILLATAAVLALSPGAYTVHPWNGEPGTNAAIASGASGTNYIVTGEYQSGKIALHIRCDGAATGNAIVRTYRSLNSTRYETTATTNLVQLNGTTAQLVVIDLSRTYLGNNGSLKVVIDNTNSAALTNIGCVYRFNAPNIKAIPH